MIREKLIFKVPMEIAPTAFHPSDLTGGQLYLRKDQATASSWISDIGTARDFVQGTATQQPTISANSVDFDGVNDVLTVTEAGAFASDFSGILFFSGYWDGVNNGNVFTTADSATSNQSLIFRIAGGSIQVLSTVSDIVGTTTLASAGYYYGYVRSDGGQWFASVNGSAEEQNLVAGANNGKWFADVLNRDDLSIGALLRSTPAYSKCEVNKIYYNNTVLTPTEISDMNTFMSDPNNY